MDLDLLIKAVTAVAPVLVLLFVFDRLDIFNLITFRTIMLLVLTGGAIATFAYFANWRVEADVFPIGRSNYSRYVAPPVEESLKAALIVALFAFNRLGFKLDAAIAGFAIGAGFSVVENGFYLIEPVYAAANLSAWLVRGFGTAVMHGGATAIFAVITHEMMERQTQEDASKYRFNPLLFIPGLALAIAVHAAFNQFTDMPVLAMAITLLLVPMTLFFVFARSDQATHAWLKSDYETHQRALSDIRAGRFAESESGRAIAQLVSRFPSAKGSDALAYVELKTELILRAEEIMLAKQDGRDIEVGDDERQKFERLEALERSLGWSVLTAMGPRLGFSRNDLWELAQLKARIRS